MQSIEYKLVRYPFEYPFGIAKGTKTHQDALLLKITFEGFYGFGETTTIHYYQADVRVFAQLLDEYKHQIQQIQWQHPSEFHEALIHVFPNKHFLISALDMAIWDIYAQMQGKPLFEVLGYTWHAHIPPTDYTLGVGDLDLIPVKIKNHPFDIYKIKLDGKHDAEILKIVRQYTSAQLRLDINEGWTLSQALAILPILNEVQIESIEQPFHRSDIHALQEFKKHTTIPIIADEAFTTFESLENCVPYYDGINIKLSKCGGITPAVSIIEKATAHGLHIMLGSMSDGIIGSSALSHLAPKANYIDIDGPFLFKDDFSKGIQYHQKGSIVLPQNKGIGAHWI